MTTRAAYVRLFPYCAPAALFIHQMASTPVCFLFFPLYKPSPLFDKIQADIYLRSGLETNQLDYWPNVFAWPRPYLSDSGRYILKMLNNVFMTGLPLGVAFIPSSMWPVYIPIAIIIVIVMASFQVKRTTNHIHTHKHTDPLEKQLPNTRTCLSPSWS